MTPFLEVRPTIENHWRAIVLFGRNVATYKFALAKALLELRAVPNDLLKLDDLAVPFARNVCEHLQLAPKQATSRSSRFLEACRKANLGEISDDQLRSTTVALGFNNVLDAFHRLGPSNISRRFFVDERKTHDGIRLTDEARALGELAYVNDLMHETEARWRLVETAWEVGLSRSLVEFDRHTENLLARGRRITVTSSRSALNGYQKGHCFYCFAPITTEPGDMNADVDHFFPWAVRAHLIGNVDGVWNLVLACRTCNRGANGKFDLVPAKPLVERLHKRNEFLITSHHPLRETLLSQTGASERDRAKFLQKNYAAAVTNRIAGWTPKPRAEPVF
ncbi:hypothetical protein ACFQPG_07310 [Sphingomonas sp. GCM10030256]|uniref:hypothetical protein n=1 Tax=Sphingomonas sp. GCM10030256 TaxID=3273427 RepID=UPI003610D889